MSTSGSDRGHEAPSGIKKLVLRGSFTWELSAELSGSVGPSSFNELTNEPTSAPLR